MQFRLQEKHFHTLVETQVGRTLSLCNSNSKDSATFSISATSVPELSPTNKVRIQQVLYASHNVLDASERGYSLLCCIRSFLILDTYLSFEVHTTETLAAGEDELLRFSLLVNVRKFLIML